MARRRRRQGAQLALFPDALFTGAETAESGAIAPGATPPPMRAESPSSAALPLVAPIPRAADGPPARRRALPRSVSSADARAMVWLRARGESLTAIAQQFHVSRETVLRFVRDPMRIRELEEQEAQERQP